MEPKGPEGQHLSTESWGSPAVHTLLIASWSNVRDSIAIGVHPAKQAGEGNWAFISQHPSVSAFDPDPRAFGEDDHKDSRAVSKAEAYCRLRDFRRVHTRYDTLASNFLSGVALATAMAFWL
jgi:hypothetical protein